MGRRDEAESYREQGERHARDGVDCPPSDRLSETVLRDSDISIDKADELYEEGRART